MAGPALPPPDLAKRVGVTDQENPVESFDAMGALIREMIVRRVGEDWFTEGKRFLDFGCGPGKLLRHFLPEAGVCQFIGCDIDEPSIAFLRENFSPPLHVFVCSEEPGLPLPDEHVDLAVAMSVFTHLTDHWAGWLLELHRVLKPGARLFATFLGAGMSESIADEPWDPDRIGMNVLRPWQPWDHGGPSVQHSEWWMRAHWGRAFEVESVEDRNVAHGLIVLRKRDVELTEADLLAPEPGEAREFAALRHNVAQLSRETTLLAEDRERVMERVRAAEAERARLETLTRQEGAAASPQARSRRPGVGSLLRRLR